MSFELFAAPARSVSAAVVARTASGFDSTVTKIVTAYEGRGMVNDVQQKNGGGTVKDEVALVYDGWGNLATSQQDPDSAIGGGRADYSLTWTYAINSTSGCNRALYLSAWTQPGGTPMSLTVTYSSGLDADVRRPSNTVDGNSAALGEYAYLGAGTVVGMDYYQVKLGTGNWLYAGGGSSDYTTYMDRFNRPILVKWSPGIGNSPAFVNLALDYDVEGNATALTDNLLHDASSPPKHTFDLLSSFDSLRRLYAREEGELTSGAITTGFRKENTTRNLAGRISSDQVDLNDNGVYTNGPLNEPDAGEMDDTRTYNKRNELTGRSYYSNGHSGSPVPVTCEPHVTKMWKHSPPSEFAVAEWDELRRKVKVQRQKAGDFAEATKERLDRTDGEVEAKQPLAKPE